METLHFKRSFPCSPQSFQTSRYNRPRNGFRCFWFLDCRYLAVHGSDCDALFVGDPFDFGRALSLWPPAFVAGFRTLCLKTGDSLTSTFYPLVCCLLLPRRHFALCGGGCIAIRNGSRARGDSCFALQRGEIGATRRNPVSARRAF
ncbi:MAG: hypothetical protein AB7O04_14155 [Hyphomonadaceae bacterium]